MTDPTDAALMVPARQALAHFPVDPAALSLFARAENLTFKVTDTAGALYTLRLHRPGYHTLEALDSERVWAKALLDDGIAVPEPIKTRDGRNYAQVTVAALSEDRHASLSRWIAGDLLLPLVSDHTPRARLEQVFHGLGALVAAMHNQASGWQPPLGFVRHALDEDGLLGERPFWGRFWDRSDLTTDERDILIEVRARLRADLIAYGKAATRYSIIHADLHPGNVLINGDVLAAIDFDDIAFGWHMFDLAVVLQQCQHLAEFDAVYAACVAGYRSVRPVLADDLAMIPLFLLVRGLAELGWFADRPENATPAEHLGMKNYALLQSRDYLAGRPIPLGPSADVPFTPAFGQVTAATAHAE